MTGTYPPLLLLSWVQRWLSQAVRMRLPSLSRCRVGRIIVDGVDSSIVQRMQTTGQPSPRALINGTMSTQRPPLKGCVVSPPECDPDTRGADRAHTRPETTSENPLPAWHTLEGPWGCGWRGRELQGPRAFGREATVRAAE